VKLAEMTSTHMVDVQISKLSGTNKYHEKPLKIMKKSWAMLGGLGDRSFDRGAAKVDFMRKS
jgi:hypothetical protein